jgi:hypothetical protein
LTELAEKVQKVVKAARMMGRGARCAIRRLQSHAPKRVPTMRATVRTRVSEKAGFGAKDRPETHDHGP